MMSATWREKKRTPKGLRRRTRPRGHTSEDCRSRGAFATATPLIAHSDVHIDVAGRGFETKHHGLRVLTACETFLAGMDLRRKHLEAKTLVVEQRDGVSDHHVGHLADRLTDNLLGFLHFCAREVAGDFHGDGRIEVENDAAFNLSFDHDERGQALAAINLLLHREVPNLRG